MTHDHHVVLQTCLPGQVASKSRVKMHEEILAAHGDGTELIARKRGVSWTGLTRKTVEGMKSRRCNGGFTAQSNESGKVEAAAEMDGRDGWRDGRDVVERSEVGTCPMRMRPRGPDRARLNYVCASLQTPG
jgi:hypothetical protein